MDSFLAPSFLHGAHAIDPADDTEAARGGVPMGASPYFRPTANDSLSVHLSVDSRLRVVLKSYTTRTQRLFNQAADDELCESIGSSRTRKSPHRRIKKQRRYERLATATSQLSLCEARAVRSGSSIHARQGE
ncbi:hypothetical protein HPP92_007091 [Vanilla planifolia]|uniref:Uncharacterized protein n=1 Tax=Vanilla planifolia TaxID=51239 RepID=A0A835RHJ2_VANPL|nr:hypothetical protein HPP92_007091 [Vanilla planifolia]